MRTEGLATSAAFPAFDALLTRTRQGKRASRHIAATAWTRVPALSHNSLTHLNMHARSRAPLPPKPPPPPSRSDLSERELHGTLPAALVLPEALVRLNLNGNRLGGPLPHAWVMPRGLREAQLCCNAFIGRLPPAWELSGALEKMALDHNKLEGPIPKAWRLPHTLKALHLHGNGLSGVARARVPLQAPAPRAACARSLAAPVNRLCPWVKGMLWFGALRAPGGTDTGFPKGAQQLPACAPGRRLSFQPWLPWTPPPAARAASFLDTLQCARADQARQPGAVRPREHQRPDLWPHCMC